MMRFFAISKILRASSVFATAFYVRKTYRVSEDKCQHEITDLPQKLLNLAIKKLRKGGR